MKKNRTQKRTKEDLVIEVALYDNLLQKKPFTPEETELFSKAMDKGIRSVMREASKINKE